jgi:hypothetical protein
MEDDSLQVDMTASQKLPVSEEAIAALRPILTIFSGGSETGNLEIRYQGNAAEHDRKHLATSICSPIWRFICKEKVCTSIFC